MSIEDSVNPDYQWSDDEQRTLEKVVQNWTRCKGCRVCQSAQDCLTQWENDYGELPDA